MGRLSVNPLTQNPHFLQVGVSAFNEGNPTMRENESNTLTLDKDNIYSVEEASVITKLSQNTIRRYILTGELKASRIGARIIRIKGEDIQALLTPFRGGEKGVWSK